MYIFAHEGHDHTEELSQATSNNVAVVFGIVLFVAIVGAVLFYLLKKK